MQAVVRSLQGSEIGDYLTQHPMVNCISFTGGDTGIEISKKAGMIPLQMELGGKACSPRMVLMQLNRTGTV